MPGSGTDGKKKGAKAGSPPTRCEQGQEIHAFQIPAKSTDRVEFVMLVCKANARVRLWLTPPNGVEQLLADETGKDEVPVQIGPSLTPGSNFLRWSMLTPSSDWQNRTELGVNGITRFRLRKRAGGDNPVTGGMLELMVS